MWKLRLKEASMRQGSLDLESGPSAFCSLSCSSCPVGMVMHTVRLFYFQITEGIIEA